MSLDNKIAKFSQNFHPKRQIGPPRESIVYTVQLYDVQLK